MACTVKSQSKLTVNGATTIYGGAIVSASINFGLISSPTRGTITLVKKDAFTNPTNGEDIDLEIMGTTYKMKVAGYRKQQNAGASPDQMVVNISDRSNDSLDKNFIVLNEQIDPDGDLKDQSNIKFLGIKFGPKPEATQLTGFVIPNSDTSYVDIRSYWEDVYNYIIIQNEAGMGMDAISEEDVDSHVLTSAGKTIWHTTEPLKEEDLTLKKALNDWGILAEDAELPSMEIGIQGTVRNVIGTVVSQAGYISYWDLEEEKVQIKSQINVAKGTAALNALKSKCETLSSSSSSDFTVTTAKGAMGSFNSSFTPPTDSQMSGKVRARHNIARALDPTFHYCKCRDAGDETKLEQLDFDDSDTLKAMAASVNPKVYGMYVLQSMLEAQDKKINTNILPDAEIALPGKNNTLKKVDFSWDNQTDLDQGHFTKNTFFEKYYEARDELGFVCTGEVHPIKAKNDGQESLGKRLEEIQKKQWLGAESKERPPFSIGGKFNGINFPNGVMFIQDGDDEDMGLSSILQPNGVDAAGDALRMYLEAIAGFRNRFYVVRAGGSLRTIKDAAGSDYGYYIGSSETPIFSGDVDGYAVRAINPFAKILTCGFGPLKNLFAACSFMYAAGGCLEDKYGEVAVIDFIKALDADDLKEFFTNNEFWKKTKGPRKGITAKTAASFQDKDKPQYQMFLLEREDGGNVGDPFSTNTRKTCYTTDKGYQIENFNNEALTISSKLAEVPLPTVKNGQEEAGLRGSLGDCKLWIMTNEDIAGHVDEITMPDNLPHTLKIPYYLESATTKPWKLSDSVFMYSNAYVPPNVDNYWTATMQFGVNIGAEDLGLENSTFSTYAEIAAQEGSPFSKQNQQTMKNTLDGKLDAASWYDTTPATSESITILVGGDDELTLPKFEEGLESLSISNNAGKTIVTISVGNALASKAKRALLEMGASEAQLGTPNVANIRDTFKGDANPRIIQSS